MIIDVYDFETTGVDPNSCEPVQVGCVTVKMQPDGSYIIEEEGKCYLQINSDEVPEGAYNVHGISKEMTLDGEDPYGVLSRLGPIVMGYNNLAYDDVIAQRYGVEIEESIDLFVGTKRLKAEGVLHRASLSVAYQVLTGKEPKDAHDALADVHMTLELIKPMMKVKGFTTFMELKDWLQKPEGSLDFIMPFGKHKGLTVKEVPLSYCTWLVKQELQPDLKASLRMRIKR